MGFGFIIVSKSPPPDFLSCDRI